MSRSMLVAVRGRGGVEQWRVSCDCDEFRSLEQPFSVGLFVENTVCIACCQQAKAERVDEQ